MTERCEQQGIDTSHVPPGFVLVPADALRWALDDWREAADQLYDKYAQDPEWWIDKDREVYEQLRYAIERGKAE